MKTLTWTLLDLDSLGPLLCGTWTLWDLVCKPSQFQIFFLKDDIIMFLFCLVEGGNSWFLINYWGWLLIICQVLSESRWGALIGWFRKHWGLDWVWCSVTSSVGFYLNLVVFQWSLVKVRYLEKSCALKGRSKFSWKSSAADKLKLGSDNWVNFYFYEQTLY